MITEIASGIFSATHSIVEGKNGIIFGRKRALAIDSGLLESEGQAMADFIREKGFVPDRLALTHCHNDHILGGRAFATAEVFAHANAPAVIQRHLVNFARFWQTTETEAADRLLRPTVLFPGELTIDLGGRFVQLLPTPGHCEDHVSAYVPDQRVLIAGDVVVNAMIPAFMDGDSRVLEATLEKLLALPIDRLLPGHGSLIEGAANVRTTIQWTIDYVRQIRARVRGVLASGGDKEAALAAANYDELVGDHLPRDRHKMPKRQHDSVGKVFDEESARAG
jgi:glyoxylase-like metal-dependent hydrolase (beta-lactamase superfamily II)